MTRLGVVQKLSLRRCVGGGRMPCGCTVGLYETFNGATLAVIDVRAPSCRTGDHAAGSLLDAAEAARVSDMHRHTPGA
jgi:hypothetical protein